MESGERKKGRSRRRICRAIRWLGLNALLLLSVAAITAARASPFSAADDLPGMSMMEHQESIGCSDFTDSIYTTNANATATAKNATATAKNATATAENATRQSPVRVKMLHRTQHHDAAPKTRKESILESSARDASRLRVHSHRIAQKKNNTVSSTMPTVFSSMFASNNRSGEMQHENPHNATVPVTGTVESGVTLGSGEYFMDVYVGTPARHYSVIIDTGSDLNWLQCEPCEDCYEQAGPKYNAADSASYTPLPCSARECALANTDEAPCSNNTTPTACRYFYWYGDQSNTTGDLAKEMFTVNTTAEPLKVPVVFGCGHANRGLFRGAAGLLGLGRGELSFSSQLRALYGHKFSYCLVDRDNNMTVSSTLVLGEDSRLSQHKDLRYTSLIQGTVDTFYYVNPVAVTVGGKRINLTDTVKTDAYSSGTIVDSGTTLTYFSQPAYTAIKSAFEDQISFPKAQFRPLNPCYNVSGLGDVRLPEFSLVFADGAVWDFPAENYFIQIDPEEGLVCLAIMGTPADSMSILGNYLQQNFHVLYDVETSRLGFAPAACATV